MCLPGCQAINHMHPQVDHVIRFVMACLSSCPPKKQLLLLKISLVCACREKNMKGREGGIFKNHGYRNSQASDMRKKMNCSFVIFASSTLLLMIRRVVSSLVVPVSGSRHWNPTGTQLLTKNVLHLMTGQGISLNIINNK